MTGQLRMICGKMCARRFCDFGEMTNHRTLEACNRCGLVMKGSAVRVCLGALTGGSRKCFGFMAFAGIFYMDLYRIYIGFI